MQVSSLADKFIKQPQTCTNRHVSSVAVVNNSWHFSNNGVAAHPTSSWVCGTRCTVTTSSACAEDSAPPANTAVATAARSTAVTIVRSITYMK